MITGKYYIGMHSTTNFEDGYMGSGKRLRYSIRKYGLENHKKEILEFFENRELLIEAEKRMITSDMLLDVMCMNIGRGGIGGFINEEHQKKCSKQGKIGYINKLNADVGFRKHISEIRSEVIKNTHKAGKIKRPDWTGKNILLTQLIKLVGQKWVKESAKKILNSELVG